MKRPHGLGRREEVVLGLLRRVLLGGGALVFLLFSGAEAADALRALESCPDQDHLCVPMMASLLWQQRAPDKERDYRSHPAVAGIDARELAGRKGFGKAESTRRAEDVTVNVTGRLNGGDPRPYQLILRAWLDGPYCHDFTVATVGRLGPRGRTILTEQGALEFSPEWLQIGCPKCVALIDQQTLRADYKLSPHWDQRLWKGRFAFQPDGRVYWNTRNACVDPSAEGDYREAAAEMCRTAELRTADEDWVDRVRDANLFRDDDENERLGQDLYEIEGAPFLVYIWGAACS